MVEEMEHPSSFTWMNHFLAMWRAKKVTPFLKGKILDAGCGIGRIVEYLPDGVEYIGEDFNPNLLAYLAERRPGLKLYCLDIQKQIPEEEAPFDTIINLAVIEHLDYPQAFLHNCFASLKPGGAMVVTTPTKLGEIARFILAFLHIVPKGKKDGPIHGHMRIFSRPEIVSLMEECGFHIIASRYFQFWMNQLIVGEKAAS